MRARAPRRRARTIRRRRAAVGQAPLPRNITSRLAVTSSIEVACFLVSRIGSDDHMEALSQPLNAESGLRPSARVRLLPRPRRRRPARGSRDRTARSTVSVTTCSAFKTIPTSRATSTRSSLLAAILAQTESVRVFADVANLPLRPPAVLAKAAATLDLLSGGRFELGIGAGGYLDAAHAMGAPALTPAGEPGGAGGGGRPHARDVGRRAWRSPLRRPLLRARGRAPWPRARAPDPGLDRREQGRAHWP